MAFPAPTTKRDAKAAPPWDAFISIPRLAKLRVAAKKEVMAEYAETRALREAARSRSTGSDSGRVAAPPAAPPALSAASSSEASAAAAVVHGSAAGTDAAATDAAAAADAAAIARIATPPAAAAEARAPSGSEDVEDDVAGMPHV